MREQRRGGRSFAADHDILAVGRCHGPDRRRAGSGQAMQEWTAGPGTTVEKDGAVVLDTTDEALTPTGTSFGERRPGRGDRPR